MREETLLTPLKVARKTTYLEWGSQPSLFKHYPRFCYRIALEDLPELSWLSHLRYVTSERLIGGNPYYQLNVPSAGNLHPLEIYLQIRNVTGVLSGIYHLDPLNAQLVLIQEIEGDGIEGAIGMEKRFNGVILMVSLVPFRSFWKYGLRSWRYGYLDLGHQLGAWYAIVRHFGLSLTKMSHIDALLLNTLMGMGEDEFIAAVYAVGEVGNRPVQPLQTPLMRVAPCDYTYRDDRMSKALIEAPIYTDMPDFKPFYTDQFERLNRTRRSAREFFPSSMRDDALETLMHVMAPPSLEIVAIVLQAHAMQPGVYRKATLSEAGDFRAQVLHLLLDQRFCASANMVLLIYAKQFNAAAHIEGGIFGEEIYLVSEHLGVGCSGIGAFYDNEGLYWSNNPLLYAVAIGGKL
ncbi:MAG: nitroreductase family protein [Sulfuricurvum sp.]|uniref:nitroreductase family protein n=1 Tax=Sulfuricurvum sp. TaxID=2025608 RepID=UPI0025D9E771|nr:nitroreductase family protein [Sulfuricurvum sp.]MCK9374299.1 nitroreductase family protein [Sulfuricurvum sp.]